MMNTKFYYKMHIFLFKIASKLGVHLIHEIKIKTSSVWFKIHKNAHIFDAMKNWSLPGNIGYTWQQQCTDALNMCCGDSQACKHCLLPAPLSQTQKIV